MTQYALGRRVQHDPRSLEFPAARAPKIRTVNHQRNVKALDQKDTSACTGFAMAGALMTAGLWDGQWRLTDKDALDLYSKATALDGFPGTYPPDDTGSSGLAVAKAAQAKGYITSYHHAFGLQHTLEALVLRPVIVGTNWYDSMFKPDYTGQIKIDPSAQVAGGHEYELNAIDAENKRVWLYNSWGPTWGKDGTAWMTWDTLDRLLHEQGDCTVPIRSTTAPDRARGWWEHLVGFVKDHMPAGH